MAVNFDQVLKAFVLSAEQFVKTPANDRNRQQLERKISAIIKTVQPPDSDLDELVSAVSRTNAVVLAESLAYLLKVISIPTKKPGLHLCTLDAILVLVRNDTVRDKLLDSFNAVQCLVSYIGGLTHQPSDGGGGLPHDEITSSSSVLVKCLEVTQFITYGSRLTYPDPVTDKLLNFTIQEILEGKNSRVSTLCVGILANICRKNVSVQGHIKGMEVSGRLQRLLLGYLSSDNMTKIICSVSVITSLYLTDEYGSKLFNAENISQTFQFMFNVLISGVDIITVNIAADLFTDLAANDKIQNYLLVYEHVRECFTQTLLILTKDEDKRVAKVLTLFNAFCQNSGLAKIIARCVFECGEGEGDVTTATMETEQEEGTRSPFQLIKFWAEKPPGETSTHAVNLLHNVYEIVVDTGSFVTVDLKIDLISHSMLDTLNNIITSLSELPDQHVLERRCRKLLAIMRLFDVLCSDSQFKTSVAELLQSETCINLIEFLDNCNLTVLLNKPSVSQPHWVSDGLRAVLTALSVMLRLSPVSRAMKQELHSYLQDQRIVPYLSHVISAGLGRGYVHRGLALFREGAALPGFPIDILGEYIASLNSSKVVNDKDRFATNVCINCWSGGEPGSGQPSTPGQHCSDDVLRLVNRIQSSLDLKENVKISDIIDIYEQKVTVLTLKETHLEDLLNAKMMALQQADRLIDQYKMDRKQSESESRKLRLMLKESERKSEHCLEQVDKERAETEEWKSRLEIVKLEVSRLDHVTDDYNQLQASFTELNEQMEGLQRKFTNQKKAYQSLSDTADMLTKHKEGLETQLDEAQTLQGKSDLERKTLMMKCKEKDSHSADLQKSLKRSESDASRLKKERDDLETSNERLRVELENYKKLTAMINNLSSGTVNDVSTKS